MIPALSSLVMRVVLVFERAGGSELKHPNLSDSYDYTLGLLACQDSVFSHLIKCYRRVNDHFKQFFPQLVPCLTLSRNRPYHKNDNRFVEVRRFGANWIVEQMTGG